MFLGEHRGEWWFIHTMSLITVLKVTLTKETCFFFSSLCIVIHGTSTHKTLSRFGSF